MNSSPGCVFSGGFTYYHGTQSNKIKLHGRKVPLCWACTLGSMWMKTLGSISPPDSTWRMQLNAMGGLEGYCFRHAEWILNSLSTSLTHSPYILASFTSTISFPAAASAVDYSESLIRALTNFNLMDFMC